MADKTYKVLDGVRKLLVEQPDGNYAELNIARPPEDLLTGNTNPRIRVDNGETGFFEGRVFESYHTMTTAQTGDIVFKVVTATDVIINSMSLQLNSGEAHLYTYVGGTEGGTFSNSKTPIPVNTMDEAPTYASQTTITYGGTHSGGLEYGDIWVDAGQNPAKSSLTAASGGDVKGRAPGTYYFVISHVSDYTGQLYVRWQERPDGTY